MNKWIVALLLSLTFVLGGCGERQETDFKSVGTIRAVIGRSGVLAQNLGGITSVVIEADNDALFTIVFIGVPPPVWSGLHGTIVYKKDENYDNYYDFIVFIKDKK